MLRTILTLFFSASILTGFADNFKVKLQLETVDHQGMDATLITIMEGGKSYETVKVKDEDVKLELESGRVYEVWIQKSGYVPHVIHNVHDEGDSKFKITLYRSDEKYPGGIPPYHLANRTFDDVDKFTVSAERANEHVVIVKEKDMTNEERSALEKIQDMGKDQEKWQKKIDKLEERLQGLDEDLAKVADEIAKGEIEREDGEKEIEKIKKQQEKVKKDLKKLAY